MNNKINEYSRSEGFLRQSLDIQNTLLQLNLADDYMKAKRQIELLEEELHGKEKEVYDLKHELISTQMKLEAAEKRAAESNQTNQKGNAANDAGGVNPGSGNATDGNNYHYNKYNKSNNRK